MMAKRLVTTFALLALVSNAIVFARAGATADAQAYALVSLKHETVGSLTRIMIESSAPPLYTVFRPSDRLIVVDLPGGEASHLKSEYSVKSALVDKVSVRDTRLNGASGSRAVTRIEVSVRGDAHDRSSVNGNTLVLEISPNAKGAASVDKHSDHAEPAPARRAPQNRSDKNAPGVVVYPTPVGSRNVEPKPVGSTPDKVQPKPADLKPATVIRSVRSETSAGEVRIVIEADGTAQYKDFVLPNPWRVVVDISGVRSTVGNKTTTVGAASVDRFRVGQPSQNVVRVVLDTKSKVTYHVVREGASLVIKVGSGGTSRNEDAKPAVNTAAEKKTEPAPAVNAVKQAAEPQHKPEVKVAGDRIENTDNSKPADKPKQETTAPSNLIAQSSSQSSGSQSSGQRVTSQPNRSLPMPAQPPSQPSSQPAVKSAAGPAQPSVNRSVLDLQRSPSSSVTGQRLAFCDPGYVGGLISFDLRAGVDLRDMLRFISQQYGVNFIVDKSVAAVPVDIRVTDIPWNQVMDSVLRANRLGAVCESNGRIIRIATLAAVKEEEDQQAAIRKAQADKEPLVTKIIHLKYARAAGQLGSTGSGASGRSGGSSSSSSGTSGLGGATGKGSLMSIVESRLSPRGRIEVDIRTNSVIITDLPEYTRVVEDMIALLDRPEPQVEIEARIVIASRNFLRDIGSELAGAALGPNGRTGLFETTPVQLINRGLQPGGKDAGGGSSGSGSGSGSGSDSGSGGGSNQQKGLGQNLVGPFADTALRSGVPNTVLSLTTGLIGTSIISAALSAQETKGQIRTIASPRVTTTDNKTAEIVNGVQIPVQTVSNNTITTTFVTAALRLEITPQIIEENGQVLMHVVAENNTVNFSLANQFNNGTPGINTQSAESTVLVSDGGTTVMGGINIDSESHTINRTPGVSRIPLLGEMFKRRTTRRDDDEILFFLTPRIVRQDGTLGPRAPQRSSVEGMPNPNSTQRAATNPAPAPDKKDKKDKKSATTASASSGKGGQ